LLSLYLNALEQLGYAGELGAQRLKLFGR
jgi:hypothetical protein